ncbi:MAG: NAD(P)H-hydrate dehydratase [Endomicrobium sp.]|jgi:NAD(P)H-hydrate epimerase|nr:NAD(P)H-hydrate dehydratase [Endomicrobium sp.]
MTTNEIKKFVLKLIRDPNSYKYNFGHVLVLAGSTIMPGSGALCCLGALRAGVGLVTYAVKVKSLTQISMFSKPEVMFFIYKTAADIIEFVKTKKVSSLIIGPGLIDDSNVLRNFILKILFSVNIPIILDASGISCFNSYSDKFKNTKAKLIITPHMGEFSKLLNIHIETIRKFKQKITSEYATINSLVCVLKGKNTIVASDKRIYINDTGTPAMSIAGSGDVLCGIIAAFTSIESDIFNATKFAVFIHGLAGEMSEKARGQIGVIASDIAENICYVIKDMMIPYINLYSMIK